MGFRMKNRERAIVSLLPVDMREIGFAHVRQGGRIEVMEGFLLVDCDSLPRRWRKRLRAAVKVWCRCIARLQLWGDLNEVGQW